MTSSIWLPPSDLSPFALEVFLRICHRERITATVMPLALGGAYLQTPDRRLIVTDTRLTDAERARTVFHELGHHFLHAEQLARPFNLSLEPQPQFVPLEREADAFARGALTVLSQFASERGGAI